ncbi:multidrug effflux MFS transporter [Limibaculum sp. M0105]|uniref:Bcr/CflA family efflux transporter n=1 Tax=Thermohalobaculum xanthum TaxID=2753746 RepID=A0A8J7SJ11_9RHOB|nr:multidrug effflux MFS transporter [Thermohalobaculum xanthum]MBK0400670.1 multidrug effflux MFS transporter [Thermohalobaculum xanthum]
MPSHASLVVLLAALTAIGPFAMQALAPALPAVARDFGVSAAAAQLLLSVSLAAMALSTLIWGPLSDRLGRRPVLIGAMWLAVVGSAIAGVAPDLGFAVAGRVLQSAGAVAGMVLSRAIAQDVYGRDGAAAVIGQITAAMVVAPMLAPVLSGFMVEWFGWRSVFAMAAAIAVALALLARARLPETAPPSDPRGWGDVARGLVEVGRRRAFWAYSCYGVASFSSFLFFVGSAPFVMQEAYGVGPKGYGVYFILVSLTYMLANLLCGPITRRMGGERAIRAGALFAVAGVVFGISLALAGVRDPMVLMSSVMLQSLGAGVSVPNAMAGAVGAAHDRPGSASGLMGFCQFLGGGVMVQLAGFLPHGSVLPTLAVMLALLIAGLLSHLWLVRTAPVSRPVAGAVAGARED